MCCALTAAFSFSKFSHQHVTTSSLLVTVENLSVGLMFAVSSSYRYDWFSSVLFQLVAVI